jgi:5'-deoxynucleotidase YfbR-like HD superfamily hydrolase
MAALYHDVPELILGDIPATAKWSFPEVQKAFEKAEKKVMDDLGLEFVLSPEEKNKLKMADMLELVLYSHRHSNQSDQMKVIMHTGINYLYKKFSDLDDFEPVNKVLTHYNLSV